MAEAPSHTTGFAGCRRSCARRHAAITRLRDAVPLGFETPQQVFGAELYRISYRFLETGDEYVDYAPARVPPQGR